ncbi:hypothetical protein CcaCcLH18_14107 [Colletotrichum camelliae]|nr:hypothetical protein CcaCcLH18_14107 [Colletotrichum camelliae]
MRSFTSSNGVTGLLKANIDLLDDLCQRYEGASKAVMQLSTSTSLAVAPTPENLENSMRTLSLTTDRTMAATATDVVVRGLALRAMDVFGDQVMRPLERLRDEQITMLASGVDLDAEVNSNLRQGESEE